MVNDGFSRVFVVDDEELIAETLAIILCQKGFAAEPFYHPSDALQAAETHPPDLLISDVVMPEYSGVELAIRLRRRCPRCAVLLFSGQATVSDLTEAHALGHHFTLLPKPVQPMELLRAIRDLMTEKSVLNSARPKDQRQRTGS